MELESLRAVVRPRSSWEAIDLGFLLARRHYATMLKASFALTLPLLALAAALPEAWSLWASVALWWSKPAYERLHLHILSRALFGEQVGVREALRLYPRYARHGALAWSTYRRLSPTRSFDLPVTQLEGLRAAERRPRQAILHRGNASQAAAWLTMLGVHIEIFLLASAVALVALLTPDTLGFSPFQWLTGGGGAASNAATTVLIVLQHLCALLVAPFYVACGFCLYLNRRSELEGWDIELGFRRIAASRPGAGHTNEPHARKPKSGPPHAGGAHAGAAAGLAALLLIGASPHATAAAELDPQGARASIAELLEDPAFHDKRTWSVPRLILDWALDPSAEPESSAAWVEELLRVLAFGTEALLIALAVVVVTAVVWRVARERRRLAAGRDSERSAATRAPRELQGLAVTRESLPPDVLAEALSHWRAQRAREALALLYRASLASLIGRHPIDLRPGFTEGQCIRAAAPHLSPDSAASFERLARSWQRCAYGRRAPSERDFETLCREWQQHFAPEPNDEARHER